MRFHRNYRPKHVELIGIINKPLLLHLVGCLYYCISDARSYKHQICVVNRRLAADSAKPSHIYRRMNFTCAVKVTTLDGGRSMKYVRVPGVVCVDGSGFY